MRIGKLTVAAAVMLASAWAASCDSGGAASPDAGTGSTGGDADVSCDPGAMPSLPCPTNCEADLGEPYCDRGTWRCWTSQSEWTCQGSAPTCADHTLADCQCNGIGVDNFPPRMTWQCDCDACAKPPDASSLSDALDEPGDAADTGPDGGDAGD